ncbi:MAG: hypothetical protein GXY08_02130, partial [Ruminococcus sp.]|nr:hypothetical protein [Ruminococcus sp.]
DAVNIFFNDIANDYMTEDALSVLFPQIIATGMIEDGILQRANDETHSSQNASDTTSEPSKEFEVMTINELDDHELREIEVTYNHYSKSLNCDGYECHITKGYDLIAIKMNNYHFTQRIKAIYVEDEGWKLYVFDV